MISLKSTTVIAPEVIRELRERALAGASVRELTSVIQKRLALRNDAIIPVLAGFVDAFKLPLLKVLPIREWLGSENDKEIDALILPEIRKAQENWCEEQRG